MTAGRRTTRRFRDRGDAGRALAARLGAYAGRTDVLVLGLARGGVAVAAEVARALEAPLDVLVVRKIGAPGHEELALGAVAHGGALVVDERRVAALAVSPARLRQLADAARAELSRREATYRRDRPSRAVSGRTVIVIDDGVATGSTMHAALVALRRERPARIVVAVPVASPRALAELSGHADEVICAHAPRDLHAVGEWYDDFSQMTDDEVCALLADA